MTSRPGLFCLGVLGTTLLAGCNRVPEQSVTTGDHLPLVVSLGNVDVEGGTASLQPERSGRVVEILVKEGDEVKPESALLRLDSTEATQDVAQARAGLALAEARLELGRTSTRPAWSSKRRRWRPASPGWQVPGSRKPGKKNATNRTWSPGAIWIRPSSPSASWKHR
jgi:multidrug efflux pump subunit AcrA (membrane-fusion protein)